MSTLRELETHLPALVIDAASSVVQIGCLLPEGTGEWRSSDAEAGVALFELIRTLPLGPGDVSSFVFCDGPGSILGIRTAAMAIRTWCVLQSRPVFAYSSLALVAHARNEPGVSVIADARRETWHCYQPERGLRRLPSADLIGELVMPSGFRHWTPLPPGVRETGYDVSKLFVQSADADLFRLTDSPDAFLQEEPTYVAWTPRIHRAPERRPAS